MIIKEAKNALREKYKAVRKALSGGERHEKSRKIQTYLFKNDKFLNAENVFIFISKPDEVDTSEIIDILLAENKNVYVPIIRDKEMYLLHYHGNEHLVQGEFSVMEPIVKDGTEYFALGDTPLDVIIVPGLVFSFRGVRLGFGGGYIDRLIRAYPKAFSIGLAFMEQIAEDIPVESHDQKVDLVIVD